MIPRATRAAALVDEEGEMGLWAGTVRALRVSVPGAWAGLGTIPPNRCCVCPSRSRSDFDRE